MRCVVSRSQLLCKGVRSPTQFPAPPTQTKDDELPPQMQVVDTLAPLLQMQRAASVPGAAGRLAAPDAQADLKRSLLQNDAYVMSLAF